MKFHKKHCKFWGDCRGTMLLEFVLCFPVLMVMFLFIVQIAYIMICWQVVNYAAYMGARSTMTSNLFLRNQHATKVVKRVLAVISNSPAGESSKDGDKDRDKNHAPDEFSMLDGWGRLPYTKYLDKQVEVSCGFLKSGHVSCTVKFKMFLLVPVAGPLISFWLKPSKTEEENKWEDELKKAGVARNPALLSKYSNKMKLEEKLEVPYIELTSHGAVFVPYSTAYYPAGQ